MTRCTSSRWRHVCAAGLLRVPGLATLLAILLAAAASAAPATTPKPSPWDPLRFPVGNWSGTDSGEPGASTIELEYGFALGDRFLEVRNTSTYAPQEKNPRGEIHEDRGFVSWDRGRKRFVFEFAVDSESRFTRKR